MEENYNKKYLKYKEKYLVLKKEYDEIMKKNMKGGNGNQVSGIIMTAEKKLPDNTKITVILFKADWCGHCKHFKPTWEKISDIYKQKYNFITYDADTQTDKLKEYKIDSFPTVLIKTGDVIKPYNGDRSFDDFSNFLQSIN